MTEINEAQEDKLMYIYKKELDSLKAQQQMLVRVREFLNCRVPHIKNMEELIENAEPLKTEAS